MSLLLTLLPNGAELLLLLLLPLSIWAIVWGAIGVGRRVNNLGIRIAALVVGIIMLLAFIGLLLVGIMAASHR